MNRDFKGIWIPKEIWLNPDLSLQEKIFYIEIDSLDNNKGCFANNRYFSDFFGISVTRVSLVIKKLIVKGYVTSTISVKEGNKRILKTSLTKVKDPHKQKLKHNNTINNTINNTDNIKEENIKFSPSQKTLDNLIDEVNTEKKKKEKTPAKKEKVSAFNEIKDSFLNFYQIQTGVEYSFSAKDAGSIKHISNKIKHSIEAQGESISNTNISENFNAILDNLPKWYKEKGLSLTVINSKYNELITEIRSTGSAGFNAAKFEEAYNRINPDQ